MMTGTFSNEVFSSLLNSTLSWLSHIVVDHSSYEIPHNYNLSFVERDMTIFLVRQDNYIRLFVNAAALSWF